MVRNFRPFRYRKKCFAADYFSRCPIALSLLWVRGPERHVALSLYEAKPFLGVETLNGDPSFVESRGSGITRHLYLAVEIVTGLTVSNTSVLRIRLDDPEIVEMRL